MSIDYESLMRDIDNGALTYDEADALIHDAEAAQREREKQYQRLVELHAAVGEFDEEDWTDPNDWNAIDGPDVLPPGFVR